MRAIPSIFSFCGAFSSGSSWEAIETRSSPVHTIYSNLSVATSLKFWQPASGRHSAPTVRTPLSAASQQGRLGHAAPFALATPVSTEQYQTGDLTFLVTSKGTPYTIWGFGNWFRDRCVEAGVPGRAHGLRKAGAATAAENGATTKQLMAIFGWLTLERPRPTSGQQRKRSWRAMPWVCW